MKLVVWGADPSLQHFAFIMGLYDTETGEVSNCRPYQIDVEPNKELGPQKYKIDYDRCLRIHEEFSKFLVKESKKAPDYFFIEAPFGSQSARAMFGYGVVWSMMAGVCSRFMLSGTKVFLMKPSEVKKWATGNKDAKKVEMIEAAECLQPDFPWIRHKNNSIMAKEEHKADAMLTMLCGIEKHL